MKGKENLRLFGRKGSPGGLFAKLAYLRRSWRTMRRSGCLMHRRILSCDGRTNSPQPFTSLRHQWTGQHQPETTYARKLLFTNFEKSELKKRIEKETETLRRINHPDIFHQFIRNVYASKGFLYIDDTVCYVQLKGHYRSTQ